MLSLIDSVAESVASDVLREEPKLVSVPQGIWKQFYDSTSYSILWDLSRFRLLQPTAEMNSKNFSPLNKLCTIFFVVHFYGVLALNRESVLSGRLWVPLSTFCPNSHFPGENVRRFKFAFCSKAKSPNDAVWFEIVFEIIFISILYRTRKRQN